MDFDGYVAHLHLLGRAVSAKEKNCAPQLSREHRTSSHVPCKVQLHLSSGLILLAPSAWKLAHWVCLAAECPAPQVCTDSGRPRLASL